MNSVGKKNDIDTGGWLEPQRASREAALTDRKLAELGFAHVVLAVRGLPS